MKTKKISFGVFTDLHYSDRDNDGTRFFQQSLAKLKLCVDYFLERQVDFMVCLGDLIDCDTEAGGRGARLDDLGAVIKNARIPFHLVLGNHDVAAGPYRELLRKFAAEPMEQTGPAAGAGYRSFELGGLHFVILDTNYSKDGLHYESNTIKWDSLHIDRVQLEWLETDLRLSRLPAVVLTHGNLDFRSRGQGLDPHIVKNYLEAQDILERSGKVGLVLQGHCHAGACSRQRGIPFVTLRALVDSAGPAPVLVVTYDGSGTFQLDYADAARTKAGRRALEL